MSEPLDYFLRDRNRTLMFSQFKALWRCMTAEERGAWARFVRTSKDAYRKPLLLFLDWVDEHGL
jgi:hypothetical protein